MSDLTNPGVVFSKSKTMYKSKKISDKKLKAFRRGSATHRNPFETQKKLLEERKKREDEESAKVYADFAASFQPEPDAPDQKFVRADTTEAYRGPSSSSTAPNQSPQPPQPPSPANGAPPMPSSIVRKGKKDKNKAIDSFLEELKRDAKRDADRPRPREESTRVGSRDVGDVLSTNIYVGNLSASVTEPMLLLEFGRFGPVGSVKIMWPRTAEEMGRRRHCGFVSFMKRADASAAMRELQGFEMDGSLMRLGWGKSVPLPAKALPMPDATDKATLKVAAPEMSFTVDKFARRFEVVHPADDAMKARITTMAKYTAKHGAAFENAIMLRERANPDFAFLFNNPDNADHMFYRWRVYSLSQNDTVGEWRSAPFQMVEGAPFWVPPPVLRASRKADTTVVVEDKKTLDLRREFTKQLDTLSLERSAVMHLMGFALDKAEFANVIASGIEKRMCEGHICGEEQVIGETPVNRSSIDDKVAMLYLISDVLHNSSVATVKNAWSYRQEFQDRLPHMFEAIRQSYQDINGRLTAEIIKDKVLRVLRVWHSWSLYPGAFLEQLERTFFGREITSGDEQDRDGGIDGESEEDEDIDGVPFGDPFDNDDGDDVDDVDGEPF